MNVAFRLSKPPEWHAERAKGIGGSDANIIMSGDDLAILRLWQEKRGDAQPEDLSRILPVQMGVWTEPLNAHWYKLITGNPVLMTSGAFVNPDHPFMRANLDGTTGEAVWEAKHVNQFSKMDEVMAKYQPQLHHNMLCAGLKKAVLSVFIGTMSYEIAEVELDPFYADALMERETLFWGAVQSGDPPVSLPAVEAPKAPTKFRTVDFTGNNAWAANAADWLKHNAAAKTFEKSAKELKALVEPDVEKAHGHGIIISRSKAGALTIKQEK